MNSTNIELFSNKIQTASKNNCKIIYNSLQLSQTSDFAEKIFLLSLNVWYQYLSSGFAGSFIICNGTNSK